MSGELQKYFKLRILPDPKLDDYWDKIVVPEEDKFILLNYAKMISSLDGISPAVAGLYKAVLFYGPTGTGKSSIAKGYANKVAELFWNESQTTLLEFNAHEVLSEWLGQSSKRISEAFDQLKFCARHQPTILIGDEIEMLFYDRLSMMNPSDPSDLVRAVDTLLREIDELRFMDRILFIATSNLPGAIDNAAWDKFDVKIKFGYPNEQGRAEILQNCFNEFSKMGLELNGDDATSIAKATTRLSPRGLTRVVSWAMVLTGKECKEITLQDLMNAAEDLVRRENANFRRRRRNRNGHSN